MREIKVLDIDNIFDEFLVDYIRKNRGKYNEKEWEEKIPLLYVDFGTTPLEKLGGLSPEEYYEGVDAEKLANLLKEHIEQHVSVSDFLCEALIKSDCEKELVQFIDNDHDEELVSYCINILNDKNSTIGFDRYFDMLLSDDTCEDMKELIGETLANNADIAKEKALKCYDKAGSSAIYLLEIFSMCSHDDRVYNILISELKNHENDIPLYLSYVTKYGDERALEDLLKLIEKPTIDYVAFRELKFAIELFGGEYNVKRDFSFDKNYNKIKNHKVVLDEDSNN